MLCRRDSMIKHFKNKRNIVMSPRESRPKHWQTSCCVHRSLVFTSERNEKSSRKLATHRDCVWLCFFIVMIGQNLITGDNNRRLRWKVAFLISMLSWSFPFRYFSMLGRCSYVLCQIFCRQVKHFIELSVTSRWLTRVSLVESCLCEWVNATSWYLECDDGAARSRMLGREEDGEGQRTHRIFLDVMPQRQYTGCPMTNGIYYKSVFLGSI